MPEKKKTRSEPYLNQGLCSGCGSCAELCPEVFAMDPESGLAYVREPAAPVAEGIDEAIACCPEDCIEWEEERDTWG